MDEVSIILTDYVNNLSNLNLEFKFLLNEIKLRDESIVKLKDDLVKLDRTSNNNRGNSQSSIHNDKELSEEAINETFNKVKSLSNEKLYFNKKLNLKLNNFIISLNKQFNQLSNQSNNNSSNINDNNDDNSNSSPLNTNSISANANLKKRKLSNINSNNSSNSNINQSSSSSNVSSNTKKKLKLNESDNDTANNDNQPNSNVNNNLINISINHSNHNLNNDNNDNNNSHIDNDEDDNMYCYCQRKSFGEMIGCDNDDCKFQWFHLSCVNVKPPLPEVSLIL